VVYNNIEAERARLGFTKEEVSTRLGISMKTYYNWINGINPIPSTALINMADMFGTDIDYLLGRIRNDKPEGVV
jgi:transcriptional regulator with XRE-family HTH domain